MRQEEREALIDAVEEKLAKLKTESENILKNIRADEESSQGLIETQAAMEQERAKSQREIYDRVLAHLKAHFYHSSCSCDSYRKAE